VHVWQRENHPQSRWIGIEAATNEVIKGGSLKPALRDIEGRSLGMAFDRRDER